MKNLKIITNIKLLRSCLWPNYWSHRVIVGVKWKIWIVSFYWYSLVYCVWVEWFGYYSLSAYSLVFFKMLKNAGNWPFLFGTESHFFGIFFICYLMMNWDRDMKTKPYEAQNTKFSEYERSSLISSATSEILKFENRTSVIIEISRF